MKTSREYRKIGLNSLSEKWGPAVGVCFVYFILVVTLSFAGNMIGSLLQVVAMAPTALLSSFFDSYAAATIFALISIMTYILVGILASFVVLVVTAPFALGLYKFFLKLVRGQNPKFDDLFNEIKRFKESAFAYFYVSIFTYLWILLFVLLAFIALLISTFLVSSSSSIIVFLGIILALISITASIYGVFYVLTRYSFVFFIMNDSENAKPLDILKQSKDLMKGHSSQYILLYLTYTGWAILSILTCGVGFLFLFPYIYSSTAAFYDDCLKTAVANNDIKYVTLLDNIWAKPSENNNFNQYQNGNDSQFQNNIDNQSQNENDKWQ